MHFYFLFFFFLPFPIFRLTRMMTKMRVPPPSLSTFRSANHEDEHSFSDSIRSFVTICWRVPFLSFYSKSKQRRPFRLFFRHFDSLPPSTENVHLICILPIRTIPNHQHLIHDRMIYIRPLSSGLVAGLWRRLLAGLYNHSTNGHGHG